MTHGYYKVALKGNQINYEFGKCLLTLNFNRLVGFRVRSSDRQYISSQLYRHRRQLATLFNQDWPFTSAKLAVPYCLYVVIKLLECAVIVTCKCVLNSYDLD